MSLDTYFVIPEKVRTDFIDDNVIKKLLKDSRQSAKKRVIKIVNNYAGQDLSALCVLSYAAEQGRFEEFAEKLERYYKENLKYIPPEARRIAQFTEAFQSEVFFLKCYKILGIEPL